MARRILRSNAGLLEEKCNEARKKKHPAGYGKLVIRVLGFLVLGEIRMWSYYDLKRWPIMRWLTWPRLISTKPRVEALSLPKHFFKTRRLIFRPLQPDDVDQLLSIVSKPNVVAFVDDGQPMNEELVKRWIEFSRLTISKHGSGTGALVSRSTGEIVGWAGLSRPHNEPPEIVYGLDDSHWRQGYGGEIAAALVKWCRKDLRMEEIRATVYPENTASIRILEKLGFQYVDDLPNDDATFSRLYVIKINGMS